MRKNNIRSLSRLPYGNTLQLRSNIRPKQFSNAYYSTKPLNRPKTNLLYGTLLAGAALGGWYMYNRNYSYLSAESRSKYADSNEDVKDRKRKHCKNHKHSKRRADDDDETEGTLDVVVESVKEYTDQAVGAVKSTWGRWTGNEPERRHRRRSESDKKKKRSKRSDDEDDDDEESRSGSWYGYTDQAVGAVKETLGRWTGKEEMEREGRRQKKKGKLIVEEGVEYEEEKKPKRRRHSADDLKRSGERALDKTKEKAREVSRDVKREGGKAVESGKDKARDVKREAERAVDSGKDKVRDSKREGEKKF